jgi:UDP-N-acetylmuramoyl-L-alanyl-D-glutamate--2,6-diaminopimelate ligase
MRGTTQMKLSELLAALDNAQASGDLNSSIAGLTQNSRQVLRDYLFAAVRGAHTDGHLYIEDAVNAGAAAVVCEEADFPVHGAAKIVVPDSRVALALLADAFYSHPSRALAVIGVTGTNGKTTVTYLVRNTLAHAGISAGLIGTIEYRVDGRTIPAERTTPDPVLINSLLAEMVAHGCGAAVMEVSSHAIDQKRVDGIDFDVAVFTNLTQDHLDYHGDLDSYLDVKARLFQMLGERPDSPRPKRAVVNIDDERAGPIIEASRVPVITFGFDGRADVDPQAIVAGVAETIYVPGRLEFIDNDCGLTVVVDYAHTDDALKNVLSALREVTTGKIITVFGCGGDRDPGKRPKMGAVVNALSDTSVITSDNPRSEEPDAIIAEIVKAYGADDAYVVEPDRKTAIERAISLAQPGDTVLIAGKGHETYQQFRNQTVVFDDREVARAILDRLSQESICRGPDAAR